MLVRLIFVTGTAGSSGDGEHLPPWTLSLYPRERDAGLGLVSLPPLSACPLGWGGGWFGLVNLLLAAYSTHSRVCMDTSKYLSFSNQGDGVSLSQEKIHKNKMMSKIT